MDGFNTTSKDDALFNLYKVGTIAVTILTVLMSIVLFSSNMTAGSRYFDDNSAVICTLLIFIINIMFAATAFIVFRKKDSIPSSPALAAKFLHLFPAVASLVAVLTLTFTSEVNALTLALAVSSIGPILFNISYVIDLPKAFSLFAGYIQIVFLVLMIAIIYTDMSVEMNAPIKLFSQLAALAAMISTLSDIRMMIGRENVGLFTFSKIVLTILAIFTATGMFIEVLPHVERYGTVYVIFPAFLFLFSIPSTARFFCATLLTRSKENGEDETDVGSAKL